MGSANWKEVSEIDIEYYKVLKVKEADVDYLWGNEGKTIGALAKAAGCQLYVDENKSVVEIYSLDGNEDSIERGIKYIQLTRARRKDDDSCLSLNLSQDDDNDLTI